MAGDAHRKGAATREEVYQLLRHNAFGGLKLSSSSSPKDREIPLASSITIHPFGPKIVVMVHFVLFGCVRDCLVAL